MKFKHKWSNPDWERTLQDVILSSLDGSDYDSEYVQDIGRGLGKTNELIVKIIERLVSKNIIKKSEILEFIGQDYSYELVEEEKEYDFDEV